MLVNAKFLIKCAYRQGGLMRVQPQRAALIVTATAVLHNIAILANLPDPEVMVDVEEEVAEEVIEEDCSGREVRENIVKQMDVQD